MREPQMDQLVPDARAYVEAVTQARATYDSAYAEWRHLPFEQADPLREEASTAYVQAEREAWDRLAQSEHPLVAWIGKNVDEYKPQATTVLRYLTPETTLADLDALSRNQGWCSVWTRFRAQALVDGVIEPVDHTFQMRTSNSRGWRSFWEYQARYGAKPFPQKLMNQLAEAGVTFLSAEFGGEQVMFQLVDERD